MRANYTKETDFIKDIAPAAQRVCKRYGYLPSVLIAQACHENGFGIPAYWDNTGIFDLLKNNNLIGQKADLLSSSWSSYSVWPGKSFSKKTPEEYNGKHVIITDSFRIFDSPEQSLADFVLFLLYASNDGPGGKPKYGPEVVNIKDPAKLIQEVKNRGYATGSTYPTAVMKIVNKHNLTKYDNLEGVEPTDQIPPALKEKAVSNIVKISNKKITDITARNKSQVPRARSEKIKFIVCHYLGVPNADNPDLYDGGKGGHYNIERSGAIYKAADPKTAVVWHCGGELQGSGGHSFYKICTNFNSIGIECGVCYTEHVREGDGDSNKWYFTEETQESLVFLVSKLMDEYGIDIDHVIRHFDVTGKICPNPYVKNNGLNGNWTWAEFKANLKQYRKDGTITIPTRGGVEVWTTPTDLRKGSTGEAVKKMQQMLIALGYSCGTAGADGDFGSGTEKALKAFQAAIGYEADGIYGPNTKAALEARSTTKKASDITVEKLLTACKSVMDTARKHGYKYGDSHATPPTTDKTISCDRMIAKALWDLGFTDQRTGGEVVSTLDAWLKAHGFTRSTKAEDIKKGSILLVKGKNKTSITHAFVCVGFNYETWKTTRYDAGTQGRIEKEQPLKNVAWAYRQDEFVVYNIPAKKKTDTKDTKESIIKKPVKKSDWTATGTATATVNYLNVRAEANKRGAILRQVMKGNRFEVDGKIIAGWVHVKVIDQIGYIWKDYIKYDN